MERKKFVGLVILDGWGIRFCNKGNAVAQANTPNYDRWLAEYESSILDASGEAVGLVAGQMGNSEVGHLNIGSGRVVYQSISKINRAIEAGEPRAQAIRSFRIWAKQVPLVNKALDRMGPDEWGSILQDAASLDRVLKGRGSGSVWAGIERICLAMCRIGCVKVPA